MTKTMSEGQRSYEAKRAAKAGMSLEKWMEAKAKQEAEDARARIRTEPAKPTRPPGLLSRLIDRAHKPL